MDAVTRCCAAVRKPQSPQRLAALYCCIFVALGCSVVSLGPAILELAVQTHSTVTEAAYTQGIRGFAYLVGGFSGPLYDRLPGHVLLSLYLLGGGLATALLPTATGWWGLAVLCVMQGLCLCGVDIGGNILLLAAFDGAPGMAPWMQALHFAFALGAFIAPLLLRAVEAITLAGRGEGADGDGHALAGQGTYTGAFVLMGCMCMAFAAFIQLVPSPRKRAIAGSAAGGSGSSSKATEEVVLAVADGNADGGGAAWSTLVVLPEGSDGAAPPATTSAQSAPAPAPVPAPAPAPTLASLSVAAARTLSRRTWVVVIILSTMLCFYVGAETGFGFFATAYVVFALGGSEASGNYMTSVFWGTITLGRLAAVPLASRVKPARLLVVTVGGSVVTMAIMLMAPYSPVVVWGGAAVFGLCMSSIYPTAVALTEGYMPIQGKHATAFVVGGSLGEWGLPFIIGTYIGGTITPTGEAVRSNDGGPGPIIMLWVTAAGTAITLAAFLALIRWGPAVHAMYKAAGLLHKDESAPAATTEATATATDAAVAPASMTSNPVAVSDAAS